LGAVEEKVFKLYRHAYREYGFEKEIFEQVKSNLDYYKEDKSYEECLQELKDAGIKYANAYKKLTPYTRLQKLSKMAAIALGEMR